MEEEKESYYPLFIPLKNKQEKDIINIWNDSLNEEIYYRKKLILEYCTENECDFLTAICDIKETIVDCFIVETLEGESKGLKKYISYNNFFFESIEMFLEKRMIKFLNFGNPITDEQKEIIDEMVDIIIDTLYQTLGITKNELEKKENENKLNSFLKSIFIDIDFKKIEWETKQLNEQIEILCKERKKNPDNYINDKLIGKVDDKEFEINTTYIGHTKEMYFPSSKVVEMNNKYTEENKPTNEGIIQVTQNSNNSKADDIYEKEPYYRLYQQIINDNFNSKMLVTYISKILEDDYQILSLREEFNFFFDKSAESIVDYICESKKRYTDTQAKQISLVSNHLEIILAYFESDKQITPLSIEKVTLFRDKIPCLSTILSIITKIDSTKFKDVENNLSKVWMYNQLIYILEKLPLFEDKELIKQQNYIIDNYITKLNIEKKSIDVYQNDRENLINEIISDINSIINKTKKNDIIVIEEKKDSIIDEHEEIYKEIQKKLNNYISYDGVEKYKTMINYKINNKNFNNIDGRSYFVMNSNTKRDICKFAQCFNITLKEAEKIFKNIEKKNINLNTKDSVTINMTDPNDFEKALIEVRNKCLHKINPEKFKLL